LTSCLAYDSYAAWVDSPANAAATSQPTPSAAGSAAAPPFSHASSFVQLGRLAAQDATIESTSYGGEDDEGGGYAADEKTLSSG